MHEKMSLNYVFFIYLSIDMEAECSDDVMKLRVNFNASFSGLIYSAGKKSISFVNKN